jgi:hypothetical protein
MSFKNAIKHLIKSQFCLENYTFKKKKYTSLPMICKYRKYAFSNSKFLKNAIPDNLFSAIDHSNVILVPF